MVKGFKKGSVATQLHIADIAYGGEGIAKVETEHGEFVIFVKNTIPGQIVDAKIIKKKRRYAQAKLVRVQQRSEEEVDSPYHPIPGAPFIRLPIERQEFYKQQSTLDMFARIGDNDAIHSLFDTYIPSPKVFHYRNKMEYSFSTLNSALYTEEETRQFSLGFKRRGQWWAVENMEGDSGLFDADFEDLLPQLRQFFHATSLPAWDPGAKEGFYRFLVVRKTYAHDKLLVNLVTTSKDLEQFDSDAFIDIMTNKLGDRLAGIIHTLNDEVGDATKLDTSENRVLFGEQTIQEEILGLTFNISMQSFFQTNPACAEKLYSKVLDYVKEGLLLRPSDQRIVMDLFCGTGTIAQLLTQIEDVDEVVGVDIVASAIQDAKKNAEQNSIQSVQFYASDVKRFLIDYPQYQGKLSVVVLDPPRSGIAPKALTRVIDLGAASIVYVSCNPSTQARDAKTLAEHGYRLVKFSLVDQFPHTAHIESIALFVKD